jgi:tetratricopeptide (TPR) repeat protein
VAVNVARSTKITVVIVVLLLGTFAAVTTIALRSLASFREGTELAREGYAASLREDFDTAISHYNAALRKTLGRTQRSLVYLNRGAAYNSKWRFDKAIGDQTEALRLNPKLADAHAGRGFAHLRKGEMEKAIADLTEAICLDPNSQSAYYNRGLIRLQSAEHDQALADFEEAVRCNPKSGEALVMRGICYVAKNDLDRALASFDGAVAVDPMNPMGYMERSNLYSRRGDRNKQERDYQEALRLNPNIAKASSDFAQSMAEQQWKAWSRDFAARTAGKDYHELYREAQTACDLGNYERAIEVNNDLLAMSISSTEASVVTMNRGNAYRAKGDLDTALRDYDEAIRLDPRNAGAHVNRAVVLTKRNERAAASKAYDEAIRLNPKQWQAYFDRAANLRDEGQPAKAIADLTEVIKLNPQFVGAYVNRAAIYISQGELEKAITDCNTAIEFDPNVIQSYLIRVTAYQQKKDYAKASSDLEAILRLRPKKTEWALNSLAWLRATCPEATMRDGAKAVELATQACELSRWKNWTIIDTLAAAYAEVGDFERAIKYQKDALLINGASDDIHTGMQKRLDLYNQHKPYREELADDPNAQG